MDVISFLNTTRLGARSHWAAAATMSNTPLSSSSSSEGEDEFDRSSTHYESGAEEEEEDLQDFQIRAGLPTNHLERGEKLPFQPPAGYEPASFSQDVLSLFDAGVGRKGSKKELWCIKIPDGVSPASLDGLQIPIPSSSSSRPSQTLAELVVERFSGEDRSQTHDQPCTLVARRTKEHSDKKSGDKQTSSSMTQLIAMAGGQKEDQSSSNAGPVTGNEEMESLRVMLPDASRPGGYRFAEAGIKHHLQLVLDMPTVGDVAGDKTSKKRAAKELAKAGHDVVAAISAGAVAAAQGGKRKQREQPWHRINYFFHPAGALTEDEEAVDRRDDSAAASDAEIDKILTETSSTSKKSPKPQVKQEPEVRATPTKKAAKGKARSSQAEEPSSSKKAKKIKVEA